MTLRVVPTAHRGLDDLTAQEVCRLVAALSDLRVSHGESASTRLARAEVEAGLIYIQAMMGFGAVREILCAWLEDTRRRETIFQQVTGARP